RRRSRTAADSDIIPAGRAFARWPEPDAAMPLPAATPSTFSDLPKSIMLAMTGAITFVKIVFLLFLFQDVVNVVLVKVGLIDAIPAFSSIKEVLVIGLLAWHW